jgi:hypothetical protein
MHTALWRHYPGRPPLCGVSLRIEGMVFHTVPLYALLLRREVTDLQKLRKFHRGSVEWRLHPTMHSYRNEACRLSSLVSLRHGSEAEALG